MNNLWIGITVDEKLKRTMIDNGGEFLSANTSQDNILYGFRQNGLHIDSINASKISSFPLYKKTRIKEYSWVDDNSENISVGFWNFKYVNLISKKNSLCKVAKKWALKCEDSSPYIFIYQMHSPFISAAICVKKILPNARLVLIVPDLPQYMDLNMTVVKKGLKSIDWFYIKKYMKKIDYYILYSEHMADYLKLEKGTWMVMEGSINQKEFIVEEPEQKSKAIMYSGVCDEKYGIPLLLDAFDKIEDPECELWITGGGNAVQLIQERATKDQRIKYWGYLPTRRELLLKQKEAIAMISMRMPTEEASKYCFPSKIFEYMLSGNPVLSFKIAGIPDEYFDYLMIIEEVSTESIVAKIQQILAMNKEERRIYGERSQKYILETKNNIKQANEILQFVQLNKHK